MIMKILFTFVNLVFWSRAIYLITLISIFSSIMKNLFNLLLTFFFFQIFFAQQGANDTSFNVINDCKFGDGSGLDQKMSTMAFQIDNKIIIGGYFEKYNGENRYRIVRINYDGSIDQNYNHGSIFINSSHPSNIKSIAIQADGKAIIGGSFISNYGTSNNSFIRLNIDGTIDTTFNIGTGFINSIFDRPEINSIVIQNDGKILVGGEFTSFNGISRKNIIRLLANGTIDLTFDPGNGFDQKVNVIEVQSGNKIVIGGEFGSYNGIAQGKIIRLNFDGTIDNTFNIGLGFQNGNVLCITSQNDGKLIVGGGFQFFDTQQKKGLARLNNDGTIDNTLDFFY